MRLFNSKVSGDDAAAAWDCSINDGCANHFIIQNNGERLSNVTAGNLCKFATTECIEAECHIRAMILVKAGLRINEVLTAEKHLLLNSIRANLFVAFSGQDINARHAAP